MRVIHIDFGPNLPTKIERLRFQVRRLGVLLVPVRYVLSILFVFVPTLLSIGSAESSSKPYMYTGQRVGRCTLLWPGRAVTRACHARRSCLLVTARTHCNIRRPGLRLGASC